MECDKGVYHGPLPTCVPHSPRTEFDVYALFQKDSDAPGDRTLNYPDAAWRIGPYAPHVPADEHGNTLPSNLNVFDLEGLLANIYTQVFKNNDVLWEDDTVFVNKASPQRWPETRDWQAPHEYRSRATRQPIYRDIADTAVWYRLKVMNRQDIDIGHQINSEYTPFGNFANGKATNAAVLPLYEQYGEVVGLQQTVPGFAVVWRAKDRDRDELG